MKFEQYMQKSDAPVYYENWWLVLIHLKTAPLLFVLQVVMVIG